jgi:dienelactone hydrolase
MPRARSLAPLVSLAAFVAFLLASAWLGRLEQGGPPHADLTLESGTPATLFLPESSGEGALAFSEALPAGSRPPVVVLAHGIASDRASLSGLARHLAGAGFAVLTLDLRGHGENRNPFPHGRARADAFAPELAAAVDFLRSSPLVDGSHIALGGHSMGAGAALDFATRDSGLDAVILISGGASMLGPQRAPNVLFLVAEGDPPRVAARVAKLTKRLSGAAELAPGETVGDFRQGTAVRRVEIPGADHLTILWSDRTAQEIAAWLDAAFRRTSPGVPPSGDPRAPVVGLLAVLMLFVLPGLGLLVGRITPVTEHLPAAGRPLGLALLAVALFATLPLATPGRPGAILSIEVGDLVVTHFALAGIGLLVVLHLRDRVHFASPFAAPGRSLLGAAIAVIGVYVLMQPFGTILHRLSLTPERAIIFALAGLGLLPLALAMQMLLRRGPPLPATLYALAGRALVVLAMLAGVSVGVLPPVVLLMIPPLVIVFLMAEVLASSVYVASRNLLAIAAIDAGWLALVVAAVMPVRV